MEPVTAVFAVLFAFTSMLACVAISQRNHARKSRIVYRDAEPTGPQACEWCGDIVGREFRGRSLGSHVGHQKAELKLQRDVARRECLFLSREIHGLKDALFNSRAMETVLAKRLAQKT